MTSSPTMIGARLLADVGGTNARFAWQAGAGAGIEAARTLPCADHATLAHAIDTYLRWLDRPAPPTCAIAIANPVLGDEVTMTNHHWAFSIAALKAHLGLRHLLVINDFTALALALPLLPAQSLRQVGGGAGVAGGPIGLIGPGTGLGVSGLLPDGRGGWLALQGEGGHATLAAVNARETAVLQFLSRRHGHVSAERAVCGQGLMDIRAALIECDSIAADRTEITAAQITQRALANADALCVEALELFCAFLGIAAGNLALTLGAKGGVYIGGGIVPRLGTWFDASPFRERFDAKGRFRNYLSSIPVYVIDAPESPAFLGLASALDSNTPSPGLAA